MTAGQAIKLFFISVNESLTSSSIINAQEIFFIFVEKCKSLILQYAADLPPVNLVISDLNSLFCCALMRKHSEMLIAAVPLSCSCYTTERARKREK